MAHYEPKICASNCDSCILIFKYSYL